MKKLTLCLLTLGMSLALSPTRGVASHVPVTLTTSKNQESAEARVLLGRLDEIKTLSNGKLTARDKLNLRAEIITIREQLAPLSGGIYLSTGAVILILIILIILL